MALSFGSGGLSELSEGTKKQQEMSRAVNPANGFQGNSISPEKAGVVKEPEYKEASQKAGQKQDFAQQQRTAQTGAGLAPVAGLQENLGSFNLRLQAQVNAFLNGQTMSNVNTQLTKGGTPTYNAATGMWEAPKETAVEANTSALVGDKVSQQKDLQAAAGDMFTDGKPKTFEEVLRKFGDKNNDGVIDAQEQQWLNEAFDIVNGIRRVRNIPSGTAEYEALMAQLAARDKNGMVAGLIDALDQYDKIANMKVTGADADAYYLRDLLTMSQDQIGQEVQKALSQSSGLFGADYEAYVKREFDKSARQYSDAAREDATVMQKIKEVSNSWLKDFETQFESGRVQLNEMFKSASDKLIQDLKKAADEAAKSGTEEGRKMAKGIEQAKEWFVDTQTLVNTGGKDFGAIVFQALVDSRLGAEPKRILKHWLGRTIGEDVAEKGVLAQLMDQISNTGYFWTENSAGQQVQVSFNARQKMEIVRIMNNPNMSNADKIDKIESMISQASQGMGERLDTDLGKVLGPIQSGQLQQSLDTWEGAMVNSMKDFGGSLVQAGYTAAVSSMGRQNAPQVMQQAIEQKAQEKLNEINRAYQEVRKAIEEKQKQISDDISKIQQNTTVATDLSGKGVQAVQQDYRGALQSYMQQAMTPSVTPAPSSAPNGITGGPGSGLMRAIGSQMSQAAAKPMTALEAAYQRAMITAGNYTWTPSAGGEVAQVAMPADINTEKYAKPYSAVAMLRNLKSVEASFPQYQIIVRDYLGADAAKADELMNNSALIFKPGGEYLAVAMKIADAFSDANFAKSVWTTTPNSKAIEDMAAKNAKAAEEAQRKIYEGNAALQRLEESMAKARQTLGQQAAQAARQAAVQLNSMPAQAAPQQVPAQQNVQAAYEALQNASIQQYKDPQYVPKGLVGQFRKADGTWVVSDDGNTWYEVSYGTNGAMQRKPGGATGQTGISSVNLRPYEEAYLAAQQATANQGASSAPQYVTSAPASSAPLTADISRETANNMFNMALDGQAMQFTDMPEIDIDAMRRLGHIQYVPHSAGLDPTTYAEYVNQKWVPAGAEIAVSSPYRDVKPSPTTPVAATKPPAQTPVDTSGSGNGKTRTPPVKETTPSPVVETYQSESTDKGGKITVQKHQDGTWSGKYPDGTPLDQTTIDQIGASTPGSNTVYSGVAGEKTVPVQDIIDKVLGQAGIKTPNSKKAENANSYYDGKDAALRGEPLDDKRMQNDPAYASGVNDGYRQRQAMLESNSPEQGNDKGSNAAEREIEEATKEYEESEGKVGADRYGGR